MRPARKYGAIPGACIATALLLHAATPPHFDFTDITKAAGVTFRAQNGASPEKLMIETMGSGLGMLDYNGDGRLDLVFVSGGGKPGTEASRGNRLALYRNDGKGTDGQLKFSDQTAAAGLAGSFDTYGMGVAVADYDNDGHPDLLLTGFPRSVLFHNEGNGTYREITGTAGVENRGRWATSAGWFDYDGDGLLDLAIANYVADFSWSEPRFCGDAAPGRRTYCHPDVYQGTGIRLYHNEGQGRFRDVTEAAKLGSSEGKCLGLVLGDLDGDGRPDIFVANDSVANFFYRNQGDGTFREEGLSSGTAFSEDGAPEAGMGVDAADMDGDLMPDLYVTHLDNELNRLYRNARKGLFHDATLVAGLGAQPSLNSGFGVKFGDFDNSGRQHLVIANGHILDNIALFHPRVSYREYLQLLENTEGKFRDISAAAGAPFQIPLLGRGLAIGDLDNDGLIDFAVSQNSGPPVVARNRSQAGNWITLRLIGTGRSNRDAVGAVVTVTAGAATQRAEVMGGTSYCSASDLRVHFGLGAARQIQRLQIRWPSGAEQIISVEGVNREMRVVENGHI